MVRVFEWILFLYLVLKLCHLLFAPSDRESAAPLWARVRAGEPMLAIGVVGCSALLTLYGAWFARTSAQRWYAYSTACYSRLAAAHELPLPMRAKRLGSYDAAESMSGYLNSAELHGVKLGIPLATIDGKLGRDRLATAARYARITAAGDGTAIAASFADLDRCLNHVGAPRGELLNP